MCHMGIRKKLVVMVPLSHEEEEKILIYSNQYTANIHV